MSMVLFVLACGFVSAGLLNAVHLVLQNQVEELPPNGMVLYFHSPAAIAWSMFVCTFAGPYLVISQGLRFWQMGHLPHLALAFCAIISVLWSFCSGVFIVETMRAVSILVG